MTHERSYEVVTFDCYGTLIDWETGIRAAFREIFGDVGQAHESEFFEVYEREERKLESDKVFRPYKEILSSASQAVLKRMGIEVREDASKVLTQQLPTWTPFPDTNPALEKLAARFELGILSNVDTDLITETLKPFTVPFDIVITAEQIRSYKPRPKHFEEARKAIGQNRKWLHVAASLYHDIEPVARLGIDSVWVNRQNLVPSGGMSRAPLKEVKNLIGLVDWLKLE